jgi:hypothetical protein
MKTFRFSLICFALISFSLSFSNCSKKDGQQNDLTGQATYVLDDEANANLVASGKLVQGSASDESVTVDVGINAVSTGVWEMSTAVVDGVSFYGKGVLHAAGVQKIMLHAKGTPTKSGFITLTLHGGTQFTVEVNAN